MLMPIKIKYDGRLLSYYTRKECEILLKVTGARVEDTAAIFGGFFLYVLTWQIS
ncbi:hypothetical protein [Metabacillus sediminilitoris]|uniref:hypothetical protein n=1 Tax=Metabacillus sediminilitoris TaxID=2567941 RepID=UPI001454D95C|nr:hypothetical protein [Metabacillus sediminilitoris]